MNSFKLIQDKLESFIRRYYTNEFLKGLILFFAIGLLYFLFTLFLEYILWLNIAFRTFLFWLFVVVELGLFIKFIFMPLAKLFKLQKGIDYETASRIIGKHFPEIDDKLLNVLQLKQEESESELLLASIAQKSSELKSIPFKLAINFKENLRYLKYASIPILILLLTYFTGNFSQFTDSYKRVVHYTTAYKAPAPFQFVIANNTMDAIENKDFKLIVKTLGEVVPENVDIVYNNEVYVLEQKALGEFEYVFKQLKETVTFGLSANNVKSEVYTINLIKAPLLLSFEMVLNYPKHTKKKLEILKGTGNALVPEGTKVEWKLKAKSTDQVFLYAKDTTHFISNNPGVFSTSKNIYNHFEYTLSTSNKNLKNYENLAFNIDVVKDEFPEIILEAKQDSLNLQTLYFYGQVIDDYGFRKLELVYYPVDDDENKQFENIPISDSNISEFVSAFPNNLNIKTGVSYNLFFQVFDNDAINGFKRVKSNLFSYRKRTKEEERVKALEAQNETIKGLDKSLEKFDEQEKRLDALTKMQKEKTSLNFNDKKKIENFFKKQKKQDEMMKNFNKKLKDNLEEFEKDNPKEDVFKEQLKKRLKDNEEKLIRDEKLLKEIKKLQEKINKEHLIEKLDKLKKQNESKKRSLKQLLELTKRFYVEKKLEKLSDELKKLGEKQESLSNKSEEENTKEKQDKLNNAFEALKKEIEELETDNKDLKKPIKIPRDKLDEQEVEDNQQKASELLEKKEEDNSKTSKNKNFNNAQKSQKKAAQKMQEMSEKLQKAMAAGEGESMQEDTDMLRQILDNLVLFSFDQESLMNTFSSIEANHNKFATHLKKQKSLQKHFEHIDDSLFALSLRQPKISELVNREISEVYYNSDKALELLAENQLDLAVSRQQFVITAANNLANFLSNILDNMQERMRMSGGKGKGKKGDVQLPDIITGQEKLNKMMEKVMKKGEKGDGKKGEKEGESGKPSKGEGAKAGEGVSEDDKNGLLYKIYQEQQALRRALEEKLDKSGERSRNKELLKKMEDIELDLLNEGFTNSTLQKMLQLKHQLLKLDNATFKQGREDKRESKSSKKQFDKREGNNAQEIKQYFQTTEILNRQALPLQHVYKKRVKEYFKKKYD